MKRYIILAAAAAMTLASCQKTEQVGAELNGSEQEITFTTYSGRAVTKGTTAYTSDMKVTAYFNSDQAKYFENKDFTAGTDGSYTTSPKVYWPVDGDGACLHLDFYAVNSTAGYTVTTSTSSSTNDTKTIVVDSENAISGSDDLVAARLTNKTNANSIVMPLGHKLTKVAFKAVGADTDLKYVITAVTVKAFSTGTYTFATGSADEAWSNPANFKSDYSFTLSTTTLNYNTTAYTLLGADKYGLMLLPVQSSDANTVTATFTYTVTEKNGDVETLIFSGDNTVDLSASASTDWGINKSIIYKVTLPTGGSDNAIKFDGELTDWDSTPTYPESGTEAIQIGDTWWAPVNCGYHATNYPHGKLYQWGRHDGCGYNDGSTYTETLIQEKYETQVDGSTVTEDATKFYWGSTITDWLATKDDTRWNSVTEVFPKTAYDPCPSGWRVPTYDELNALIGNTGIGSDGWDSDNKGYWFNGTTSPVIDEGLFLPAAGYRSCSDGDAGSRGSYGDYWSSSVDGDLAKYLYFDEDSANMYNDNRAHGYSVRCVQE